LKIKIFNIYIIFFTVIVSGCDSPNYRTDTNDWIAKVDSLLLTKNANSHFDGTIVIGSKDEILYQKALGKANRTWDIDLSNDTRFDIASLNKSFQAALILIAVEEGHIFLTDKLISFFTELNFDSTITIHHLLTHTSGLPDYDAVNENLKKENYKTFKRLSFSNPDYAHFISKLETVGKPGLQFHYSNFGYHLLALILEKVYQKPFSQLLQQKICKPYGLDHTFSEIDNQKVHKKVAEGYSYNQKDSSYRRNNFIDLTLGRRIFSTTEDLYKWSKLLSNGEIISNRSYILMTTNHLQEIDKDNSYGYGFVVFDGGNYKMGNLDINQNYILHGGSTEGFKAMLTNINDGKLIIALLSNVGDRTNELKLTETIIKQIIK